MLESSSLSAGRPNATDATRRQRGARISAVATLFLVLMPLVMWIANRSAPLMLGLSAAAFAFALLVEGRMSEAAVRLRRVLADPIALALSGFALWALLSLAWSHRSLAGLDAWAEMVLPAAFALAIAGGAAFRAHRLALRGLALAIALACGLMIFELASGLSQRIALGIGKQMIFIFNRPVLTCIVLSAPVIHLLWTRPGSDALDRALAALCAVMVAWCAFYSDSGAAKLAVLVLAAAWIAALVLPRLALAATALAFLATMAIAPVLGPLADRALPPVVHQQLASSHSRDRVDIWLSFGEAIRARPVLGSGFGSSAALQTHPVAAEVSEPRRLLLAVGHPHSAPVQAWVETGLVGAVLLIFAGLAFLARLRRLPARELAPRLALFAAAFSVASVAHGAWQGWWIAALSAAAIWFAAGWPRHAPADREVG